MSTAIAVSLDEAASMAGVSLSVIKRAVRAGDLVARYPSARPVILVDELIKWLSSCPTESRRAPRR